MSRPRHQAANLGMRVIMDLVVNHTSNEHPWFRDACSSADSRYREWYVWSAEEPADERQGTVFPGVQETTWTYHDEAGAWYYHRFFDFQPDLNMANPEVRREIEKIMSFWIQLGVSGFRVDAAPFIIELTTPNDPNPRRDYEWLTQFRSRMSLRRGDAVLLMGTSRAGARALAQPLRVDLAGGAPAQVLLLESLRARGVRLQRVVAADLTRNQ